MIVRKYEESYSYKKAHKIIKIRNTVIVVMIFNIIFIIVFNLIFNKEYWIESTSFSLVLLGVYILSSKNRKLLFKYTKEKLYSYQKGMKGEEIVIDELKKTLDDSWVYICNYSNQDVCSGDIDGILVGPKGVFLFEVKNWSGSFYVVKKVFYNYKGGKYFKNPIKQLKENEAKIIAYLRSKNIKIGISQSFIVMIGDSIKSISGKTGIFITNENKVVLEILNSPNQNLSIEQIQKVTEALEFSE